MEIKDFAVCRKCEIILADNPEAPLKVIRVNKELGQQCPKCGGLCDLMGTGSSLYSMVHKQVWPGGIPS